MRGYLDAFHIPERRVWVADPFRTHTPDAAPTTVAGMLDLRPDVNQVRQAFERFDLLDDRVRFLQGEWSGLVTQAETVEPLALLRIGAGAGDAVGDLLATWEPKVVPGGLVIVDTDGEHGTILGQVEAHRAAHGIDAPLERIGWDEVMWRKAATPAPAATASALLAGSPDRVPLAPVPDGPTIDLSVVVVFYNMRREAARTLHALSRELPTRHRGPRLRGPRLRERLGIRPAAG